MTASRQPARHGRPGAPRKPGPRKLPIVPIVGGVVAVALIATILLTFSGDSGAAETGDPTVTGAALPLFDSAAADPSLGSPIPEVVGADFDGNPVSISNDGRIKILLFLAHWCPVCQAEVPIVTQFIAEGRMPAEIDLYTVATSISSTRENYPPSAWLQREGWNAPVIVDDAASSVGDAFGLSAFPFWVFVDQDNRVIGRLTGRAEADVLAALVETLLQEAGA